MYVTEITAEWQIHSLYCSIEMVVRFNQTIYRHNNCTVYFVLLDDAAPIGVVDVNTQSVIRLWENESTIWPGTVVLD